MSANESTGSVVSKLAPSPTTGLWPAAPAPDCNPGQNAGSGMAGAGNCLDCGGISVPRNEGCIDPGSRSFSGIDVNLHGFKGAHTPISQDGPSS